ncbi:hypothetical protein TUBRATIS_24650 [Tubulinosema ratisbonensis]|uniref:Uncharacterized protein n=1 Tax=Tubulinosema ratisbonensis TaxID=291195 RepID=A0A437AIU4_9MICR|nr:hypothetical protein TUBRATIS_24650 [Tubulinosema ratisbonensis]
MIYKVILPEIISFSLLFILILMLKFFNSYTIKKLRKTILQLTLPKIIDMLEKIGLSESFLDSGHYKPNTFLRTLRTYLTTKKERELIMMFNSVRCDSQPYVINCFGLVLGTFLKCMRTNPIIIEENYDDVFMSFYNYNYLNVVLNNHPHIDYYYVWFFGKYAIGTRNPNPVTFTYAFNVEFNPSLQTMIRQIWNECNRYSEIDKTKGNDGVRFSKHVILFFNTEIDVYEFKSFLKMEKKAYGCDFELLFAGANNPFDLEFCILEKKDEFLTKDDYFLYNFIVLKNLNYKPYSNEEEVKQETVKPIERPV